MQVNVTKKYEEMQDMHKVGYKSLCELFEGISKDDIIVIQDVTLKLNYDDYSIALIVTYYEQEIRYILDKQYDKDLLFSDFLDNIRISNNIMILPYYDFLFNCLNTTFCLTLQDSIIDCNKNIYINHRNINNVIKCAALMLTINSSSNFEKLNFIDTPILYLNINGSSIVDLSQIKTNPSIRIIIFYSVCNIKILDKSILASKFPNLNLVLGIKYEFSGKIIANLYRIESKKIFLFNDEHEFNCNINANKLKIMCNDIFKHRGITWYNFINLLAKLDNTKLLKNANK
jgi:hypothetical protein